MVSLKKVSGVGSAFISLLLVVLLVFTLAPIGSAQQANATTSNQTISDQEIEALLAAGDYVPGEAIVIVDEAVQAGDLALLSFDSDLVASSETLMTTSTDEYEQTVESATISGDSVSALSVGQSTAGEDAVSIRHITNTGLSTEELLYQLRDDPRVLSVEPNYISVCDDEGGSNSSITVQDASDLLPSSGTRNLTDYQWGNSNTSKALVGVGKKLGFDINPTKWDISRTTPGAENATGTVAIIDSGIDHEHPDLSGVVRNDMKDFVSWGGDHGYCPWSSDPGDTMDVYSQGTYCAGIIASEWNSFGTSGVASGVKLVAVKAGFDDGSLSISNAIKGYEYLAEAVGSGLDLKAINNSWEASGNSRALSLAVTKLGDLGAISIFAAGDAGKHIDNAVCVASSLAANPYAVVVDAADAQALLARGSNYGTQATNIVAPGDGVLSTCPLSKAQFMPEAIMSGNIKYENFISSMSDFKFHKVDPLSSQVSEPIIGGRESAVYYDNQTAHSWGIKISEMSDGVAENGDPTKYFYMLVPIGLVSDQNLFKHLGLCTYLQSSGAFDAGCKVSVLGEDDQSVSGWISSYGEGAVNAWNHRWVDIEKKGSAENLKPLWRSNSLTVLIEINALDGTLDPDDMFYVDSIGLATDGVLAPYAYGSGTSMAAAAATGAAAVLAKKDDSSAPTSEQAMLRAARLEGSVQTTMGDFDSLCTSGGALDLSVAESDQYSPVLREATIVQGQDTAEIILSGYFFGATEGTVHIGGEPATIKAGTWSDNEVTVVCPTSVSSGLIEISLTSSLSKTGKMTRILELPSPPNASTTPLYEREYALPFDQGFSDTSNEVPLLGLGGFLYAASFDDPSGVTFWKLDTNTESWSKCSAMPDVVQTCSATTYDGQIYLTGLDAGGTGTVLYSYDPLTDAWTDHETNKIPAFTTLVNCGEELVVVGGSDNVGVADIDAVSVYDPATDVLTQVATLSKAASELKVAVHGSKILATAKTKLIDGFGMDLIDLETGEVTDLTSTLPSFSATRDNHVSIASVKQGFVLCGSSAITNTRAITFDDQDTYLLDINKLDAGARFEAFGKRASRSQLFYVSSTSHRDMLYAYGVSSFEKGGYALRATKIETLAQPGDLYSISYNNVEASEHDNPASYSPTRLPIALNNAQDRDEGAFVGWYTSADFSGDAISEISAAMSGDIEVWAQWETDTSTDPKPDPKPGSDPSDTEKTLSKAGDAGSAGLVIFAAMMMLISFALVRVARKRV